MAKGISVRLAVTTLDRVEMGQCMSVLKTVSRKMAVVSSSLKRIGRVTFTQRLHLSHTRIQRLDGMGLIACNVTTAAIETTTVKDINNTTSTEDVTTTSACTNNKLIVFCV